MLPFNYDRLDELEAIFAEHGDEIAAVIMEPARSRGPAPGFLEGVREIAHRYGAVLVFDEVSSGWRMNTGGIHLTYGVNPDVAVYAKAMSNGYPMAAVIGTAEVMQAAQSTFISSAYWTERIGPAAALATIKKHRRLEVGAHLIEMGERVQAGWKKAGEHTGLNVNSNGIPPLSHLSFKYDNEAAIATLFTQLMLDRDILASVSFYPSLAHTTDLVDQYLEQVDEVFQICADAVEKGAVESSLIGPIRHPDFRRLT
jgi:glutamate-1-semialdehyde 2,1-aminomutase